MASFDDILKEHGLSAYASDSSSGSSPKQAATTPSLPKPEEEEKKPTFWERIKNVGKAGGLQTVGSYVAAGATAADATAERRNKTLEEAQSVTLGNYEKELEKELGIINAYENNTTYNGQTFTREEYEDALDMAKNLQFYVDAMSPAYETAKEASMEFGSEAQKEATAIINKGAEAQEEAKEGTGKLGSFLVDAGVAGVQMAGDAAAGLITGSPKGAMLIRSFGAGANSAAQSGGSVDEQLYEGAKSAALEYFTEKLFGGNPIYDDGGLVTDFLYKAADKFGDSQAVTKVLSSLPVKMAEEGLEEVLAAVLDPVVNLAANWIDGGARETDMPGLGELLREGAIGALLGGAANVATGNVGNRNVPSTNAETQAETDPETLTAQEAAEAADIQQTETDTASPENAVKLDAEPAAEAQTETPEPFDPVRALAGVQTPAPPTVRGAMANVLQSDTYYHQPPVTASGPYIPIGENPSRSVAVPVANDADQPTSRFYRTVLESDVTTPDFARTLDENFENGIGSYVATTNEGQQRRAVQRIQEVGYTQAVSEVLKAAETSSAQADTAVEGMFLMKAAQEAGDMKAAADLYIAVNQLITAGAQTTQSASVYKQFVDDLAYYEQSLTPPQRLTIMQDVVDRYNDYLRTNNLLTERQRKTIITIPKSLSDALLNAKTEPETQAAVDAIKKSVYSQAPVSWREGWNRIRYFTMLFNPRTHVKNLAGNTAALPARASASLMSTAIQTAIRAANKTGSATATRAFLNPFSASDRALIAEGFSRSAASLSGSPGKYNDFGFGSSGSFSISDIEKNKTFSGKFGAAVDKVTNFSGKLLQKEDLLFSRRAYAIAFARDCKANGVTALQIETIRTDPRVTNAAKLREKLKEIDARSTEVARHTTYQEARALTEFFTKGGVYKPSDDLTHRVARDIYNISAPFKSTPTNMAAQTFEYSPAGLIKSVYDLCVSVRRGKISTAKAIDNFCSGFSGSILFGVGAWLVHQGLLTLHGTDDEKQDEFNELQGWQAYSLHIGDTFYSINDLGIASIPLIIGGEVYSSLANGDDRTFGEKLESVANITTPIFETSMLSAVTDFFEKMQYEEPSNWLAVLLGSCAQNVISQTTPTAGGAIERTTEDTVYSTFIDRTGSGGTLTAFGKDYNLGFLADKPDIQYGLGTILNKIPGVEYSQIPRMNAWGGTEYTGDPLYRAFTNFISPGYISHETFGGAVDEELQRLYDTGLDGSSGVFPDKASQSVKVNGHYLTADEYVKYQSTMGGTSLDLLQDIMGSSTWRGLTDQERIDVTDSVYDYARAQAQLSVDSKTEVDSWITDELELRAAYNMSLPEYVTAYARYGKAFLDSDATKAVVAAGGSMNDFYKAKEAMSDLPKAPGRSNVLSWQKMIYMSNQDFPEAAKEAFYQETMNSDNTYDEWQTAKENGYTMKEWAADHYDSYVSGAIYYTGLSLGSSQKAEGDTGNALSDFLAQYG